MKYRFQMSALAKNVAQWQLENYHEEKRLLERMKSELITIPVSMHDGTSGRGTNYSRPTEIATFKILSAPYIERMETGVHAVEMALSDADQIDRDIINMVYWKKSHSLEGAANMCFLGKTAAYQRMNRILGMIAYRMGYIKSLD